MSSAALLSLALVLAAGTPPAPPVLVELFTSEACDNCPAQEEALARLARDAGPGAPLVPLAFHMDAYDSLGWKDRFGSEEATRRQRRYNSVHNHGKLFAPQLVVDGTRSFLADAERARVQAADAATFPKLPLRLSTRVEKDTLVVEVGLDKPPEDEAEVWVALAEDGLVSRVTAGPNKGRTLTHTATVRLWKVLPPPTASGGGFTTGGRLKLEPGWKRERMRVVVALQKPWGGRIEGLASGTLPSRP